MLLPFLLFALLDVDVICHLLSLSLPLPLLGSTDDGVVVVSFLLFFSISVVVYSRLSLAHFLTRVAFCSRKDRPTTKIVRSLNLSRVDVRSHAVHCCCPPARPVPSSAERYERPMTWLDLT